MAYHYKVIEQHKENPYFSVVQKSGVKVEFTISDVWTNIQALKKEVREIEAKVRIEKATMENILRTHKEVIAWYMGEAVLEDDTIKNKRLEEKDRLAIDMFSKSRRFVNGAESKLEEYETAIRDDERSLKECCDAIGIIPPEETLKTEEEKKQAEAGKVEDKPKEENV